MNIIDVTPILDTLTDNLEQHLQHNMINDYHLVGIRTGGVWVAQHLMARLAAQPPMGIIDISFYRDDFSRIGLHPAVQPSDIPFNITDKKIVLVDDVIQTGRTIRAALDTLFEYGRPASVILACLVVMPGQELPIRADVVGMQFDPSQAKRVKLTGPEPLQLQVLTE